MVAGCVVCQCVQLTVIDELLDILGQRKVKTLYLCLVRRYNADLKDTQELEQLQQDAANVLQQINNTALPGN